MPQSLNQADGVEIKRAATEAAINVVALQLLLIQKGVFTRDELAKCRMVATSVMDQTMAAVESELLREGE